MKIMSEYKCSKCDKIFESHSDFEASFARDDHQSYCVLPTKYKVLKILLSPLIFLVIPVLMCAFSIYAVGAIIIYPFGFVLELVFENKISDWHEYIQWVGLEDKDRIVRVKKLTTKEKQ
jgi:hypothetical protein